MKALRVTGPEKGGRKPAAARRVSLFLAGVAPQDTWSAACESAVARMRGGYVMGMEGAEKQARRLWDKFGMKEVSNEREVRYVVCWRRSV